MAQQDNEFDDRHDDDRPRRGDDEPAPKKKNGCVPILLILLGLGLLGVCGVCGFGAYYMTNIGLEMAKKPDEFLGKVSQNDFSGAYNMLSPRFKGQVTLAQFTTAMKNAKLDKNTGMVGQPGQAQGNRDMTITATTGVSDGKTTSVSFKFIPESPSNPFKFILDDISGPDIKYNGAKLIEEKPKDKSNPDDEN